MQPPGSCLVAIPTSSSAGPLHTTKPSFVREQCVTSASIVVGGSSIYVEGQPWRRVSMLEGVGAGRF